VSIIQGVALGVLAQTVAAQYKSYDTVEWIRAANAFLLIVVLWQEYMVGATAFAWILTIIDALGPFGLGVTEFLLIFTIAASPEVYHLTLIIFYGLAFVPVYNYLYHAKRGFARNRYSMELIGRHPRWLLVNHIINFVIIFSLWIAARRLQGERNALLLSVLATTPV
jgi:hypothetical protein